MSAVLKTEHLETIFDHAITDNEFEILFGFLETQADYVFALDHTDADIDLYQLYQLRGDVKTAALYLQKLDTETRKRITLHCCLDQ